MEQFFNSLSGSGVVRFIGKLRSERGGLALALMLNWSGS